MKSHACVERIEEGIAVLELRLTAIDYVPPDEGEQKRRFRYPRKMVQVPVEEVINVIPAVKERDIIVVEHTEGIIQSFCYIDYKEKERRLERAQARRERLKTKRQKSQQTEN